jgi:hypothetical protein
MELIYDNSVELLLNLISYNTLLFKDVDISPPKRMSVCWAANRKRTVTVTVGMTRRFRQYLEG